MSSIVNILRSSDSREEKLNELPKESESLHILRVHLTNRSEHTAMPVKPEIAEKIFKDGVKKRAFT